MSALTYLLVANESDAQEAGENFLSENFQWHDFCSILDPSVLVEVRDILSGNEPRDGFSQEDFPPVIYEHDPEEGCWVMRVPDEWVKLIAETKDGALSSVTHDLLARHMMLKEWVDQETLDVEGLENFMRLLRNLSKDAVDGQKALLLYISD